MDPMLNAYLMSRIAVAQDICCCTFAICFAYWLLKLGLKGAALLLDGDADGLQPIVYQLHRFRHAMTALTLLSFFGAALLPDKAAVAMMLNNRAADNVAAAIEAK